MNSIWLTPYITTLVAFITAFTGIILEALALRDSITLQERRQRMMWMLYFCALFIVWLYYFLHIGLPQSAVFTGAPYVLAILSVPVLLCHAVSIATSVSHNRFSFWNYFIPIGYFLIYSIWTPIVPKEVQDNLIHTGPVFVYKIYPGYEAYCITTGSIAVMRGILSAVYGVVSFSMITRCYRCTSPEKRSYSWLALYILIVSIPLINGLLTVAAPLGRTIGLVAMAVTSLLIIGQMIIIISFSFSRLSLLFLTFPPANDNCKTSLTREQFEQYYIISKRYLDPGIRLTDLLEPLETNRTTFSGFINKTYGMSFSRLTAHHRLREMERIKNLPENQHATIANLVTKAGFSNEAAYYLARRNEKKAITGEADKLKSKNK